MVRVIPFGKLQKIWAVICGDAIFLLYLVNLVPRVCSADLEIVCSGYFFHHVKFYSFMFMRKISTRVIVCVIGWVPMFPVPWAFILRFY